MAKSTVVLVGSLVVALTGCTRWSGHNVYGPEREVARQLLGSPGMAETKSSSLNAGFAGRAGGGGAVAGLGANTESVTLKHCVQQAELSFEQPYEVRPKLRGRGWDIAGAILLGLIGAGTIDQAQRNSRPDAFDGGSSPTQGYVVGGALIAGGIGLLVYSYGVVPGRQPAVLGNQTRRWNQTRLVESSGCGPLPGDVAAAPIVIQAQPAASPDAVSRLQQLDKLRASGAINDADYARKRKEIIDGI